MYFFCSGSEEKQPSTETKMVSTHHNCRGEAETRMEEPQTSQDRGLHLERPPEDQKSCPDPHSKGCRFWKSPWGLKAEVGVMGTSVASWINAQGLGFYSLGDTFKRDQTWWCWMGCTWPAFWAASWQGLLAELETRFNRGRGCTTEWQYRTCEHRH